jgi:hypothetical protein
MIRVCPKIVQWNVVNLNERPVGIGALAKMNMLSKSDVLGE